MGLNLKSSGLGEKWEETDFQTVVNKWNGFSSHVDL
ncbi:hypothetical protein E2C01_033187 [Portunus trituberculatus]|uniref:Uncharacterized protein n=1 Tax=Portunus trituberculatus TaxID=210409 RepID=A0A5B7EZH5_PORTR|nr:hypothetical protein [Portunus trituberculatus]